MNSFVGNVAKSGSCVVSLHFDQLVMSTLGWSLSFLVAREIFYLKQKQVKQTIQSAKKSVYLLDGTWCKWEAESVLYLANSQSKWETQVQKGGC